MSLGNQIRARADEHAPFHDHVEAFVASTGPLALRCEVSGADKLGYALQRVELAREVDAPLACEELVRRAEFLCEKVTYLLEPLRTIEADERAGRVLVRSASPRVQDERISYYEFLLTAGRISLERYCYDPAVRGRSKVDCLLTADQLEMLLDDLVAVTEVGG